MEGTETSCRPFALWQGLRPKSWLLLTADCSSLWLCMKPSEVQLPVFYAEIAQKGETPTGDNHPSLLIAVEQSIAAGLGIVMNISLEAAVFTLVQTLRLLESAWDRRGMFVEHIFKARSFYLIYSIILFSVSVAWFFCSAYYDDYSLGIRKQYIPIRRFVV